MKETKDLLRHLAEIQPSNALVLNVYLDMRPQVTGENPAYRISDVVLKDRFREIEKTLLPRGEALDNFRIDAEEGGFYAQPPFNEILPIIRTAAFFHPCLEN